MGKRERKIEMIKKYISNVSGTWSAYSYGNIPQILAANACSSYAGAVQPQNILGLVDITITGNGRKGLTFTESAVYFDNGAFASRGKVMYRDVYDSGQISGNLFGSSYNKQALIELVSALAEIEGESVQTKLGDVNNALNSVNNTVEQFNATINSVLDVFNNVANLFGSSNDKEK